MGLGTPWRVPVVIPAGQACHGRAGATPRRRVVCARRGQLQATCGVADSRATAGRRRRACAVFCTRALIAIGLWHIQKPAWHAAARPPARLARGVGRPAPPAGLGAAQEAQQPPCIGCGCRAELVAVRCAPAHRRRRRRRVRRRALAAACNTRCALQLLVLRSTLHLSLLILCAGCSAGWRRGTGGRGSCGSTLVLPQALLRDLQHRAAGRRAVGPPAPASSRRHTQHAASPGAGAAWRHASRQPRPPALAGAGGVARCARGAAGPHVAELTASTLLAPH